MLEVSEKNYTEFDFAAQDLIALQSEDSQDYHVKNVMSNLDALLSDRPAPQQVAKPVASSELNTWLDTKPDTDRQLQIDARHLNSTFKASLGLYRFAIKRNRADEADKIARSIKAAWVKFDASYGADAHKRHLDEGLVSSFIDAMRRHKASNPAYEAPKSSQIEGVLTPAELADFEIEISKMATDELADFEKPVSKMASAELADFEKPVSKMASAELADFEKPVSKMATKKLAIFEKVTETQNTPKTPEMQALERGSERGLEGGPSLRNINSYKNTTKPTLTDRPKTDKKSPKTKNQKIAPKPTLFTLAQNEPLHTPNGIQPRPAQTVRFIEDLSDPFKRRWHDLHVNDKLALSFIETERQGGYSFRLTFSARLALKLLAASDPTTVFCRDHLRPALKQEFGTVLPYSFRIEFSKEGTLHIHGAIISPEMERTGIEERLRGVLSKAGDSIGTSAQSHVAPIFDPLRYFYYLEKSAKETRSKMPKNKKDITSISGEMKKLVNDLHNHNRTNAKQN